MKIKWSTTFALSLLLTLVSCGKEQFGTTPQSTSNSVQAPTGFKQYSCSSHTLIKPKVDILYVVDNSGSIFDMDKEALKQAFAHTADKVSDEFDYRIISTRLINPDTDTTPNDDYLVLTNSVDPLPDTGKKALSPSELFHFSDDGRAMERGLGRIINFMEHHKGTLFRHSAHQIIVLISNGKDDYVSGNTALFDATLDRYRQFRTDLSSPQLRFLSVTSKGTCKGKSAADTYIKMSQSLHNLSDSFDLCSTGSLSNIFTEVNQTIEQIKIPHKYRYWPITFAKDNDTRNSFGEIKVYKVTGNSAPALMDPSEWEYVSRSDGENTRELPSIGERKPGKHFVRFNNLVTYPDCIQVEAKSRTEYFGYIVLPRRPQMAGIHVTINGRMIPQDSTDGWSYTEKFLTTSENIKMPYPNPGDHLPAVEKTGYMIKLNGSSNYYKSGDNVQVNYVPAPI